MLISRHAPHGACELKLVVGDIYIREMASRSTRGVWVEIVFTSGFGKRKHCHAPHGACELKFDKLINEKISKWSRSTRGVWVEIHQGRLLLRLELQSRSTRGVWVEIGSLNFFNSTSCHAPHGACELKWGSQRPKTQHGTVTLHTGRVSWNTIEER